MVLVLNQMRLFGAVSTLIVTIFISYVSARQEAPMQGVQKFDNQTFRANICDRQRLFFGDEIKLRDSLRGLNLSVYIPNYKDSLFSLDENGLIPDENPGLIVEFLDELALRAGFTWRNAFATDDPISESDNKTWSDLLEWSVDSFDISADYWGKTIDRISRGVSFPEGFYDNSIIIVTEMSWSQKPLDLWAFFTPFEYTVWISILCTIVLSGLVYNLLERLNSKSDARELEKKPGACIFLAAITLTGHFEFRPETPAAQIHAFSWSFWALLTASTYTANLASFLVTPTVPIFPVTTLEEAYNGEKFCILGAGSAHDQWLSKNYPNVNFVRKNTEKDVLLGIRNGDCIAAATGKTNFDNYQRHDKVNEDCALVWVGRTIHNFPGGFATAIDTGTLCTSLISHVLDVHMLEMKLDGFHGKVWEESLRRTQGNLTCTGSMSERSSGSNPNDEVSKALSMDNMGGIFLLHAILSAVSLLLAGGGHFYSNRKERMTRKKDYEFVD